VTCSRLGTAPTFDSTPDAACCIYGAHVVALAFLSRLLRAVSGIDEELEVAKAAKAAIKALFDSNI
jgi:hypothetical protein